MLLLIFVVERSYEEPPQNAARHLCVGTRWGELWGSLNFPSARVLNPTFLTHAYISIRTVRFFMLTVFFACGIIKPIKICEVFYEKE